MNAIRRVSHLTQSVPTMEGAGVSLHRAFGFHDKTMLDPFLLLDDFRSDNPDDYLPGFPWHPHRGIETITYVLNGNIQHGDSLGNSGVIGAGDVQWMTAGAGIVHHEMPKGDSNGKMEGFQLWANLPAAHKMMPPRYQEISASSIPVVSLSDGGALVRVIAGRVNGVSGPVSDIITDPEYLDIELEPQVEYLHPVDEKYSVFAYVFDGAGEVGPEGPDSMVVVDRTLAVFEKGDTVRIATSEAHMRLLLISGSPIGEPVAWRGPIVMNTQAELRSAFEEYQNGTFLDRSKRQGKR